MTTAERNQPSGVAPQCELAGVLRGLRLASGYTLDKFAIESGVSVLQLQYIEAGTAIPQRGQLHAYLELTSAESRPRAQALKLWSMAHQAHDERRKSRHSKSAAESATETTVVMSRSELPAFKPVTDGDNWPMSIHRQETRLTISKPSWRRAPQVSKADPSMWPPHELADTPEKFTQSLEAIKKSTGLSYKALAQATSDTHYPLATSTVHGMCTKPKLPANVDSVRCFILICGGDEKVQLGWAAAWQRLRQASASGPTVSHAVVDPDLADDAEAARQELIAANDVGDDVAVSEADEGERRVEEAEPAARDLAVAVLKTAPAKVWQLPEEIAATQEVLAGPSSGGEADAQVTMEVEVPRMRASIVLLAFFVGLAIGMPAGALLLHVLR
ncbi:hypothetical protein ACWEIJ_35450 [Lentzea sp. NPDC004789]